MPESHGRGDPAFPLAGGAGPAGARRVRGHGCGGRTSSDPARGPGLRGLQGGSQRPSFRSADAGPAPGVRSHPGHGATPYRIRARARPRSVESNPSHHRKGSRGRQGQGRGAGSPGRHRGAIPGHVPSDPEPPPGVDSGDPGIGRAARRRAPVERIMKPTRRKEEGMARESTGVPIDVAIATLNWGKYLGKDALDHGISVRVASWNRQAPNTFPAMAKTGANYLNSQLIKLEAVADGYEEGIALDVFGYVAEGSGENIFLVRGDTLYTPTVASAILPGVTRDCVITLARHLELEVREEQIPREMLNISDELFFTGTAAEITPITQVDRIPIGTGAVGPVTRKLQKAFFDIIDGRARDAQRWLFPVEATGEVQRSAKKAR